MIRIYTIPRVLSMGDTMGCGVVSIRVNRHFSRHGKLGPPEGRELGLVYTIRKAPADNGTLRRGTTSDERKGRPCWRFHCPAWWSNSQENMQINYLQRLTRKLRLGQQFEIHHDGSVDFDGLAVQERWAVAPFADRFHSGTRKFRVDVAVHHSQRQRSTVHTDDGMEDHGTLDAGRLCRLRVDWSH